MEHLSIKESIRFGWERTRSHSRVIFQVVMTIFAVQIAQQVVMRVLANTLNGILANVALAVLGVVLGIGFTLMALRIAEGKPVAYQDILPPLRIILAYIGATLIAGIITAAPLLLGLLLGLLALALLPNTAAIVFCVIVGAAAVAAAAYFALRYALVRFAILDDSTDLVKSLRTSARLTAGRKWWLLGFFITLGLLNLLGVILLFVGLLVTIPISMLAFAHVYVRLHAHNA